jgi:UDP-N-acetylmuramate: L-alanyl-gamma-D-glutamyl-meso-diaminopimelate ligase
VRTIPSDGNIILPKECEAIEAFMDQGCWSNKHYFGEGADGLWRYQLIETDGSKFKIIHDGSNQTEEATVEWRHSGLHNVTNAIAATMASHTIGISVNQACAALSDFIGVKRRMEVIYSDCNITVYDDFAHHPTAIKTTLEGLRAKVGSEFILAIIEPRSATMRMGVHGHNLASSVLSADQVMWYQNSSVNWDMADLSQDASLPCSVVNDLETLIEMTRSSIQEKTHIVIMSNGGFEGFHEKLLKSFHHN